MNYRCYRLLTRISQLWIGILYTIYVVISEYGELQKQYKCIQSCVNHITNKIIYLSVNPSEYNGQI